MLTVEEVAAIPLFTSSVSCPRGAQDEFVLAAIAQNLRRLAKLVARPPPYAVQCTA
jgi:hypothetical protein